MRTNNLESMSVNELWSLHEQVNSLLSSKMSAEKAHLEAKLRQLNGAVTSIETARRPYPPVLPKFRNPARTVADLGRPRKAASLAFGLSSEGQAAGRF